MSISGRPRIVVLGQITTMPFGGGVWQVLHYLIGLERLGFEPYYVEAHAVAPRHFIHHDDDGQPEDDGSVAAAAHLEQVLSRFGFADRWAFHALHSDGRCYGMSDTALRRLYDSAELLINLHGGTPPRPEHRDGGRLICVATDPVQLEVELYKEVPATVDFYRAHEAVFSFGENYGRPDCLLPTTGDFPILPTRQPVVLELWETQEVPERPVVTTVANWIQERDLRDDGELYQWSKHLEFLKVLDLPRRVTRPLELALARCPEEHRRLLVEHGWHVRDALEISSDLDTYREYVTASRAELTVAKDQNVRLRSGRFSDRSATYLAAGRPVVAQDTGFGNILPTGEGLFAFRDVDEAAAALEAIDADYSRHRRAAREIAHEYFAHDVVLRDLLSASGVEIPAVTRRSATDTPLRAVLTAHRFPPDAVGGVERYSEKLAESLVARGHRVDVVARRPADGPLRREVESIPGGGTVHRLTGGRIARDRFLRGRDELLPLFAQCLAESDPDVVHVNHVLDLSPAIIKAARDRGAAVVLTLHDYYFACDRIILRTPDDKPCDGPHGGRKCAETCFAAEGGQAMQRWTLRTLYFQRLLGLADRIVCPSRYTADFFAGIGAPADRLRAVSNGVWINRDSAPDDDWSTPGERGRLSLAFLGAALPHKGLDVVLEALGQARLDAVDLTTFGPVGDDGTATRLYARAEGIPGLTLRMYGEYEPHELPPLLHDVDCVVVPSQWPETFCLVAWEALARGIPVVVSRMGALPDAVDNGVNGFVYEHDRPDELAGILRRLAEEEGLVARLREGARETRIPTLADHVSNLEGIYREAIEEARSGRRQTAAGLDEVVALEEALAASGFGDPAPWRAGEGLPDGDSLATSDASTRLVSTPVHEEVFSNS